MSRAPFPLALVAASCLGAGQAAAIGIGSVPAPIALGQPLDVTVPVHLADGETLEAGCVGVDVHVGETRLGPDQVAVAISRPVGAGQALVRVRSRKGIDEPVVSLALVAGCPARVTRRFVLLADPLERLAPSGAAPDPATPVPVRPPAQVVAAVSPEPAFPTPTTPVGSEVPASTPLPASASAARKTRTAKSASAAAAAKAGGTPTRRPAQAPSAPRLQLEPMALRSPSEDPRLAAAQQAARAAEAAAAAARQQAADAQAELVRVRSAAADREALVTRRAPVDAAEPQAGSMQMPAAIMAATMAALAVVSWRRWRQRREALRAGWAATVQPLVAAPAQAGPSTTASDADGDEAWHDLPARAVQPSRPVQTVEPRVGRGAGLPSTPLDVPQEEVPPASWVVVPVTPRDLPPAGATTGAPAPAAGHGAPGPAVAQRPASARAWSLDEDADVEQRADFFVVLGLDDEATDLLRTHLECAGGRSAPAYLKLLDIHRRRGDRAAYDSTARRFSEHFNVRLPAWEGGGDTGRGLDAVPDLLAGIERRWHDPHEAVDWLESLLWRRADGATALPLAAFEDALLLCQVALRLQQLEVAGSEPLTAPPDARTPPTAAGDGERAFDRLRTADEPVQFERFDLAFERTDGDTAARAPIVVR